MPEPLRSSISTRSETFLKNRQVMLDDLAAWRRLSETANAGGGEKYAARHREAGKRLARERIERLLDPGSYFLEIAPLAGAGMPEEVPGAGVVGGIGRIAGQDFMVIANDPTVKGGAITPIGVEKVHRLHVISRENRLPAVLLVESAGADLPRQAEIFIPGGREFKEITRRSRERLPTIALVFGNSTAGGAYFPGMSDYVVMVRNQAKVFLAGPPLVKMATGEEVDDETLGGAAMHSSTSGASDYLAENEDDAIRIAREIAGFFPKPGVAGAVEIEEPHFPAEDLLGIPSSDPRVPFDVREVIARVVDGSRMNEFKPLFGPTLVTGYARIFGHPVGILGNNGVLTSESAQKGAQFIALCNQQDVPLLFLQNITGFIVGSHHEQAGIIRHGAKLINAVSNSDVPSVTLMVGNSYGAGNYAMCGRAYEPRFLFTWPNHRIAVMGGKQLAGVMELIKRESAAKAGQPVDEAALAAMTQGIEKKMDHESRATYATARLWDDGIIDPRDSRPVLGLAFSIIHRHRIRGNLDFGVFRH